MAVFELKAEIPAAQADVWSDFLAESEIASLMVLEDRIAGRAWLTGYFDSEAAAEQAWQLIQPDGELVKPATKDVRELPDADWKDSYKQHFKAQHFGPLHWVPVWERDSYRAPAGNTVLWLDPGMAFGTGNHETTRLCGERLVEYLGARGNAGSVIDAGCGSGILALSAALLGFADVRGFDLDPVAVEISRENAAKNGLENRVTFEVGDLDSGLAGRQADLVLANIQADVLMRFASVLVRAIKPGGQLVLSGILATELEAVKTAFSKASSGARMNARVQGEWSDLVVALG
ncbi:MAG TPA: 50S ribosomal protein L11 methyltransferase [Candidatus Didemnitutus sp.]|nr:50S ribosomal protein L11 methyltransferase [Candidatus Didemnitutus sp.]